MVYVDDMKAPYGRMTMCHMGADTEEELHAMARLIGVSQRWHQGDHYDVCLKMRERAVRNGAKQVTQREMVQIIRGRDGQGNRHSVVR